jgi:hypothetical protein
MHDPKIYRSASNATVYHSDTVIKTLLVARAGSAPRGHDDTERCYGTLDTTFQIG